jgi:hypothetical protein
MVGVVALALVVLDEAGVVAVDVSVLAVVEVVVLAVVGVAALAMVDKITWRLTWFGVVCLW